MRVNFLSIIVNLTRDKSLAEHVMKQHNQLNLNRYPHSCFFNIVTSVLDLSPERATEKSQLNPNNPNLFSFKFLAENFPKDYYIYFCLNCRLFFSSSSTFSHNCWNESPSDVEKQHQQQQQNGGGEGASSTATGKNNGKSAVGTNYFSPIYVKFNVRQLFDRQAVQAQAATASPQQQQQPRSVAETTVVNGRAAVNPPSSSSSSSTVSAAKDPNFSSKRLRVDGIIDKLKV